MKNNLLAIVAIVFGVAGLASADELLMQLNYSVKSGHNYHTNFKRVAEFPIRLNRIRIATRGSRCQISISEIEFLTQNYGYAQQAIYSGYPGMYDIPAGRLSSVNIHFRQTGHRRASCEILVYGVY